MINFQEESLLIIALTDKARDALVEKEYHDDLSNLDNVLLFRYPNKEGKERIALPVNNGEYTLILIPSEGEGDNHFLCIGVKKERVTIDRNSTFYHELPQNIRCKIMEKWDRFGRQGATVEHGIIWQEVTRKEIWEPSRSSNFEERRWEAYLHLYREIIDNRKVAF